MYEHVDRLFAYGINLETRVLYLGGIADADGLSDDPGITWNSARRAILGLAALDDPEGSDPITVLLNTPGGDWSYGMAIFDAILHTRSHVTIINMSHAASMSSVIFQAGDLRITAPHGYYMIHDGHLGVSGIPRSVETAVAHDRLVATLQMYDVYLACLSERDAEGALKAAPKTVAEILNAKLPRGARQVNPRAGPTVDHIAQLCGQDTFFTASEMVSLNFADRALRPGDLLGSHINPDVLT